MKSLYRFLCCLVITLPFVVLTSCASLFPPTAQRMYDDRPEYLSDSKYCSYKLEKYKFPDGKVADVYLFDTMKAQAFWLNAQKFALVESERKYYKKDIEWNEGRLAFYSNPKYYDKKMIDYYNDRIALDTWRLNARGPMTPFYQQYTNLLEQYGGQKELLELVESQRELFVVSYYKLEELGKLGEALAINSYASACYEDSKGVYWLRFSPPKDLVALRGNKKEQERHNGEIGYEVVYIPRVMYKKIEPPKLTPAKVTPFNPNDILPDPNYDLVPVAPSGNGAYYYDNTLANQLQWLAVTTACKGIYDMAYTGNFSQKNPTDYYQTKHIKKYLATNDGRASKGTTLFEGICFDYADFAYQELKQNKLNYPRVANFWMVGTFSDPNDIVAYRLANKGEQSNFTINRTPVVVNSHNHIYAHDGATSHAWFWVQATDGIIYWVDPTWTDNTGRPVYGIVRGGREVQLEANPGYCVK